MDREQLRGAFEDPAPFTTSPLYRSLSQTVADHDPLLDLASRGRPGQYPTFLFFGAVHHLLLGGADHPLACFYPSIAGGAALPPAEAGPALTSFCKEFEAELAETISSRLVQTSQVQRAFGLRLGLSMIACDVPGPVHLIEVGASAGLNLRFRSYSYQGRRPPVRGPGGSGPVGRRPVRRGPRAGSGRAAPGGGRVRCRPQSARRARPRRAPVARGAGVAREPRQRALLSAALADAAADPPTVRAGDAIDVLPGIGRELPAGEPRVVFHAATRMHVPADRLDAFDAAIAQLSDSGPLWWLSIEESPDPDPRPSPARLGAALLLRRPSGATETLAVVDGHLRWIEMLPRPPRS